MLIDTNGEALAMLLYKLYYEALGAPAWDWEQLQPEERTAWVICAQFILASYEAKEPPDHK